MTLSWAAALRQLCSLQTTRRLACSWDLFIKTTDSSRFNVYCRSPQRKAKLAMKRFWKLQTHKRKHDHDNNSHTVLICALCCVFVSCSEIPSSSSSFNLPTILHNDGTALARAFQQRSHFAWRIRLGKQWNCVVRPHSRFWPSDSHFGNIKIVKSPAVCLGWKRQNVKPFCCVPVSFINIYRVQRKNIRYLNYNLCKRSASTYFMFCAGRARAA